MGGSGVSTHPPPIETRGLELGKRYLKGHRHDPPNLKRYATLGESTGSDSREEQSTPRE